MRELEIKENLVVEEIGDSVIIFDIEKDQFYELEGVGSYIWRNIQGNNKHEIIHLVCKEYNIDEKTVAADMNVFLDELLNNQLIRESRLGDKKYE